MSHITIIHDGDGPDNFDRGDNALRALEGGGYEDLEDTLDYTIPTPDGEEVPGRRGYPISDLIADLCHLAQRHQLDLPDLIRVGFCDYAADVIEQAWKHSDGWDNCLQHEANLPRAIEVMRTAGVAEEYHEHALQRVGLLPPTAREETS